LGKGRPARGDPDWLIVLRREPVVFGVVQKETNERKLGGAKTAQDGVRTVKGSSYWVMVKGTTPRLDCRLREGSTKKAGTEK